MANTSLTATYSAQRRIADEDELLRWREQTLAQPAPEAPPAPAAPPKPPAPKGMLETGAAIAKGAVGTVAPGLLSSKGAAAYWDTFQQGAQNIADAIYGKAPQSVGTKIGQGALGALQMLGSLGAGAGAAVREAVGNYVPGMDAAIAIPGGPNSAAARIRSTVAVPALLLDPKMKTADPRAIQEGLDQPITYGELIDMAVQMVAPAGVGIGLLRQAGVTGKPPTPAPAAAPAATAPAPTTLRAPDASVTQMAGGAPTQAAPAALPPLPRTMADLMAQKGVPAAAPGAELGPAPAGPTTGTPPKMMSDLMAEAGVPGAKAGAEAAATPMLPADVAVALRQQFERRPYEDAPSAIEGVGRGPDGSLVDQFGRPLPPAVATALDERARLRAFERTPLEAPPRTAKPEGFDQPPSGIADVSGPTGTLASAIETAIQKSGGEIARALEEAPRAVEPEAVARVVEPEAVRAPEAAAPEAATVAAPEGAPAAAGRWPTKAEEGELATLWQLSRTALAGEKAGSYERQQWAAKQFAKEHPDVGHGAAYKTIDRMRAQWERFAGGKKGQRGAVEPELLARMLLGAVAGGAIGETPEEKIMGAAAGLVGGAAINRTTARRIFQAYKDSGLADETGAIDFSKWGRRPAVQATEQPYQPNYQRLVLTPELKRLSVNLHRVMKDEILERRGERKTEAATTAAANQMISEGKMTAERILSLEESAMLSREEMTAARMIAHRSRTYLQGQNEAFKAGMIPGEELIDSVAVSGALAKNVRVAQTRVAQAQQASAIKIDYERPTYYKDADVIHLADDLAKNVTPEQLSGLLDSAETPVIQQKMLHVAGVLPRAFKELMYFSYLSGEATVRNAVGGLVMPPIDIASIALAPYMKRWGSKEAADRVLPGSATQMTIAYVESMGEMLSLLRFWDPEARAQLAGLQERTVTQQIEGPRYDPAITAENFPMLGKAADYVGATFRLPSNVLGTTDAMAKIVNARMWQRFEAFHQASREGHTGDALSGRVDDLMKDITLLSDTSRARIQDYAERQTFTKDLEGTVLGGIQKGPSNEYLQALYRWLVIPFFRTPMRAMEESASRTPVLGFLTGKVLEDMQAGGQRQQIAQARMAFGGAVMGTFAYLESQGHITGDAPDDPKLRRMWEDELGMQWRSFWDPLSGKWRSYDGVAPISDLIAAGASTAGALRRNPGDFVSAATAAAVSVATSFDTKSYTRTLSDWMGIFREGVSDDTRYEKFLQVMRDRLTGLVKPGVLREIETGIDPEVRRARPGGDIDYPPGSPGGAVLREWQQMIDTWRSQVPGFSSAKDADGNYLVPPDRDRIDGNPTVVETMPFFPFAGRTPKHDPLKRHIFGELEGAGLGPWPEWLGGGRPGANVGLAPRAEENVSTGVRMSGPQKDVYAQLFSQVIQNEQGQTYRQALEAAVADPTYQNQPTIGPSGTPRDGGKARWLQRIDKEFHDLTTARVRSMSPGLEREITRREHERVTRQVPTAEQPGIRQMLQGLTR